MSDDPPWYKDAVFYELHVKAPTTPTATASATQRLDDVSEFGVALSTFPRENETGTHAPTTPAAAGKLRLPDPSHVRTRRYSQCIKRPR